ncbi:MAG: hypothetical protein PHE83_01950 [Opitutaceae bacterium]|nr:hypothetical protein [Opitutaceae bacterium]
MLIPNRAASSSLKESAELQPRERAPGRFLAATLLAAGLVVAFYFWTASSTGNRFDFRGKKNDYYNLLTQGFLAGHLYMNQTPHPDLFSPDPEVRAHAPYLLDASVYQGRYYLYFGITPVLLLFLPWAAISGHGVPENFAAFLFATAGFLLMVALFWRLRRRYFPALGLAAWSVLILAAGFCTVVPVALRHGLFYEVATCSAFAFAMLFFYSALRALEQPTAAGRWLVLAGTSYALAVGSRANLAFSGLLLPALAWATWRLRPAAERTGPALWRAALAAGVPAVLGVAGLLLYNYLRFDNPFEFGFFYQCGEAQHERLALGYLWYNLRSYYLSLPEFSRYFPFFSPGLESPRPPGPWGIENVHSQFFSGLLVLLAMAGAVGIWRRRVSCTPLTWIFSFLVCWFLGNGLIVCLFAAHPNRYLIDFQPELVLAAGIGLLASSTWPRRLRRPVQLAAAGMLFFGSFYNAMASFQLQEYFKNANRSSYNHLARLFDYPAWWWQRIFGDPSGPLRLRVTFPEVSQPRIEPLIATGTPWYSDTLYVDYLGPGVIRFGLDHTGYGGPSSRPISVTPGKPYAVVVHLGTLYPPEASPYFDGLVWAQLRQLKRMVRVELDGTTVFHASVNFYDASPGQIHFGENPLWPSVITGRFSGTLKQEGRVPIDITRLASRARSEIGPFSMQVQFPRDRTGFADPLVTAGETTRADLLLVQYLDHDHLRFALDHWGGPMVQSPVLTVDYTRPHELEVHMGSLYPPDATVAPYLRSLLLVKLDGKVVWATRAHFHRVDPLFVDVGCNNVGASSCGMFFGGDLTEVKRLGLPGRQAQPEDYQAPQSLSLCLPAEIQGQIEPLFQTKDQDGKPIQADIRYRDSATVEIGLTARGRTTWTAPLPADNASIHQLVVGKRFERKAEIPEIDGLTSYARHRWEKGLHLYFDRRLILTDDSIQPSDAARQWQWADGLSDSDYSGEASLTGFLDRGTVRGWLAAAPPQWNLTGGRLHLELHLPRHRIGTHEPLLVTGETGKGDALYLEYVDDRHLQFGFDHWGWGSLSSPLIEVDYDQPVLLDIDWRPAQGLLAVSVAGREVWCTAATFFQEEAGIVSVGANPLGFSTCEPHFEGEIVSVRFDAAAP